MASIIVSSDVSSEVNEMVIDLIHGKISLCKFLKFLNDNDIGIKVRYKNKDVNSPVNSYVLNHLINEKFSTLLSGFKNSEHEDEEESQECENYDESWKNSFDKCENDIKDNIEYAKRLINNYGNYEEDDIDHIKAVKLFHSLMVLVRIYRKRSIEGDRRYYIPNFTPENILKFIDSLGLPIDKIKAEFERGKSTYYKMKIYKDFNDFVKSMKNIYGIEDVWNPPKEIPEWFESVRDMQYRKFYPEINIINEFKKWKEENNNKDSFEDQCRQIVNDIINEFSPVFTIKVIRYFEKKYKSNDKIFMYQLKELYNTVKSAKNNGLMSFIDIAHDKDICCSFIPIAREDIKGKSSNVSSKPDSNPEEDPINYEKTLEALNEINEIISDSLKNDNTTEKKNTSSAKKSSTSKKIPVSTSVKNDKPTEKKNTSSTKKSSTSKKIPVSTSVKNDKTTTKKTTTIKSSKTDTKTESNEFAKNYLEYIFLNSFVEKNAKDLLFSYAANMDERFEELYKKLVDLKKKNKSVKLIKYLDETGNEDIDFVEQ